MAANPEFHNNLPARLLQVLQSQQRQSQAPTVPQKLSVEELLAQAFNGQRAANNQLVNIVSNNTVDPPFAHSETERLQMLRDWQSLSFLFSKAVHCTGNPDKYFFTKTQLQNSLRVAEELDGENRSFERDCCRYLINNYERLAKSVTEEGCIVISLQGLSERIEHLRRSLGA
jgi:hypothetical protein